MQDYVEATGRVIDIRLWDNQGQNIPLPSDFMILEKDSQET